MKLKDQVAVVTGAGRNIGEEVAKLFAAEGARIAVLDLDRSRGQRTVDAIKAQGGDADLFVTDVSKGTDVAAMIKAVVARFGHIDILVNNVAISDNKSLLEITEEDWDRVMTVTLKSQFLMSKHVAQQMIAQGTGGKIVNVGSTSGWQGRPRATAYSAAKAAIANFTRTIAVQLAPYNIRVNAIVPNKIGSPVGRDEFDPSRPVANMLRRAGRPEEAAKAILFLASDDSSFVIGENMFVDGGTMAMDQRGYERHALSEGLMARERIGRSPATGDRAGNRTRSPKEIVVIVRGVDMRECRPSSGRTKLRAWRRAAASPRASSPRSPWGCGAARHARGTRRLISRCPLGRAQGALRAARSVEEATLEQAGASA
jgi:NAD(P)-dependent dehydrogenase (short-subunit alcohol dehydrogenase family)